MDRRPPEHLVAGLGNPGPRYAATRHNLGFQVVELLADRHRAEGWREAGLSRITRIELAGRRVLLAQPQTFMNRSGEGIGPLLARFGLAPGQLVVVHDDLDLAFGRLRIRRGGGHGGHRGVASIMETLGGGDFTRLKIGIGRPEEGGEVVDFVLSPFDPSQEIVLSDLLARAADALESIVVEGPLRAMQQFHSNLEKREKGG